MSRAVDRRTFLRASGALLSLGGGVLPAPAQSRAVQGFSDAAMRLHEPTANHPESPQRLAVVLDAVRRGGVTMATSRPATDDDVLLVHTPQYVKLVRSEVAAGRQTLSTGDTEISRGSFEAALAAAGAVLSAVDAVVTGSTPKAFCAVRPPGHHASRSRGMGFCVFNSIAIGARHAARRHGVDRILVVDWDVHHGNGTQEVFWNDGSVLFFDTHQHPWYPGTGLASEAGEGKGRGLVINRPFPAGAGRADILGAFRTSLVPAADRFKPELVMISAGFDSRAGDPLGQFTLTDADFADLTGIVCDIASQHARGRVVSVLEGGYALNGLGRAVGAHLERLSA